METQQREKTAAQVLHERLEGVALSIFSIDQQLLKDCFPDSELYVKALGLMRVAESQIRGIRQMSNAV